MKLKNIYFFIFLNLLIILNYDNSFAKNNIKIEKKINGEIFKNLGLNWSPFPIFTGFST